MPNLKQRLREPAFILDLVQIIVATLAGLALALDLLDVWSSPTWLANNLPSITFIAICILIVSSFLERRIQLDQFNTKLDRLLKSLQPGIKLQKRIDYLAPFDISIAQARTVSIMGKSLVGVLTAYAGFILKRAQAGCKFKILVMDPKYYRALEAAGMGQKRQNSIDNLEYTIRRLIGICQTTKNIEVKILSGPPPYALTIIDHKQPYGTVNVEMYSPHVVANERPGFALDPLNHLDWYNFFIQQFDLVWQDATPLHITNKPTPK